MTVTTPAMAVTGAARLAAGDMTADPPLRRSPIPLREPEAAVSVLPSAPATPSWSATGAVPAIQGTLALALPWEAAPAITYSSAGVLRDARERIPVHDHARRSRDQVPVTSPGQRRPGDRPDDRPGRPGRPGDRPGNRLVDRAGDLVPIQGSVLAHGPGGRPSTSQDLVTAVLPEPREWATTFAQAAMEVAMGLRPAAQLIRWTSPEVHEALARRGALVSRLVRRSGLPLAKPKLRALLLCIPATRACEVAAVVADSEKVRAVAFRMEGFQGRWRVTVFDLG